MLFLLVFQVSQMNVLKLLFQFVILELDLVMNSKKSYFKIFLKQMTQLLVVLEELD